MDLVLFPGKNTSLKRYCSYFPELKLRLIEPSESPKVILCHSLGFKQAVDYCIENQVKCRIIVLDGVKVEKFPEGCWVCGFIPASKDIDARFDEVVQYNLPTAISQYPYQNARIRNLIVQKLKGI